MAQKLTDEEWIALSKARHPSKFTYERTQRVHGKKTMTVTCPIEGHGDFEAHISKHTGRGDGCPVCSGKGMTTERSISDARLVHGVKYGYDKYEYVKPHKKTLIYCPVDGHGYWSVTPSSHVHNKSGCPHCGGTVKGTKESFTLKSKNVQAAEYDYSKVVYINDDTKAEIVCKEHGSFWMKPSNHLQGQGCPKCAKFGYNVNKQGYLYILTCGLETKVGITNRDVCSRLKEINKGSEKAFEISLFILFANGKVPLAIESELLRELNHSHERSNGCYTGSTECFLNIPYEPLLKRVTELCSKRLSNI